MSGKYDNCFITYDGKQEFPLVNKSTAIFIPPGVPHAPWRIRRVDRPFIFLEVNQAKKHTNTWRAELLPKEERDKIDWSMWEGGLRF